MGALAAAGTAAFVSGQTMWGGIGWGVAGALGVVSGVLVHKLRAALAEARRVGGKLAEARREVGGRGGAGGKGGGRGGAPRKVLSSSVAGGKGGGGGEGGVRFMDNPLLGRGK